MDSTEHTSDQHISDLNGGDAIPEHPMTSQPVVDATPPSYTAPPAAEVPPLDQTPTVEAAPTAAASDRPSVESLRVAASSIRDDIGKKLNDPTAVYVALGASDLVAERARQAATSAVRQGAEFAEKARAWNAQVSVEASDVPRLAVSRALKVAGHVEAAYSDLASRGREVAERVRAGGGSDLVRRAVLTLSGRADVAAAGSGTIVLGETVETLQVTQVDTIEVVDPVEVLDPIEAMDSIGVADQIDTVDLIGAADGTDDEAPGADPTRTDVVTGGDTADPADSDDVDHTSH